MRIIEYDLYILARTNDFGQSTVIPLDLFRDVLSLDEVGTEKNECIGGTRDVGRILLLIRVKGGDRLEFRLGRG